MKTLIEKIRNDLRSSIDEKTKETSQNFFKERIKSYGVKIPVVNKIGKEYFEQIKSLSKSEIFNLCE
jgi:3-methyladenine DNA glycosylase AlkD